MAQYEMNLRDYWLIVRRRRLIIITSTVLVMLFSFWFAKQKVPVYQATAAVKFEQSMALTGLLVEVLSYNTGDNIETQASLIKSYPILEEVARRLGRLPRTATGQVIRESKTYTATLESLAGKLRTNRVGGTSILEITATSTNALEARDLANAVAEVYRDFNKSNRNGRITEARKFIENQLKEVEGRVRKAEEEVWAFRDAKGIISPGAESSMLLSLFTQVRGDIERARQQRIELEQVQQRLERSDRASVTERVFIDTQSPAILRLQATQTDLILERNNLALEVTERHPRLQAIDDRLREVRREMRREVAAQIALLRNREEILNRQQAELLQRNREVPAVELNLARLQRDAKVNDDLLTLLKSRHQEALIKESEGIEEVTIVRPATEPGAPVGGDTLNTVLVGGLLGLMLGLVLAFVQETLDTSIGTIEDVETYLEVPVLGIVPHIDPRETMQRLIERRPALAQMDAEALQSHALLITHFDPKSPVAEAYRTLRTHIQFARQDRGGKVLVVTSPTLQEGKTTTIVNLALTMAQSGQKTLLIGGNMRRPSIYRFFGIEREPGLSDILVGNARWRDCIRTVADILMGRFEMEDIMASPGLDNLHIIEAGPIPANPSELLSTEAMTTLLHEVSAEYDIVLIDTPPVLPVTDSAIVAAKADGVLLVYQAGKVGRLVLKRAKAHLESTRAKVWGVVLNDVQTEVSGYTYTHYYTHYYGEETPSPRDGGSLQRAWDALRARIGGGSSATASATDEIPDTVTLPEQFDVAPTAELTSLEPTSSRRDGAGGRALRLLLLAAVLAVVGGAVAWQLGLFTTLPTPLVTLRERLGIGPATPRPTPVKPTPPTPATPGVPMPPAAKPATSLTPPIVAPSTSVPAGTAMPFTPPPAPSVATPDKPLADRPRAAVEPPPPPVGKITPSAPLVPPAPAAKPASEPSRATTSLAPVMPVTPAVEPPRMAPAAPPTVPAKPVTEAPRVTSAPPSSTPAKPATEPARAAAASPSSARATNATEPARLAAAAQSSVPVKSSSEAPRVAAASPPSVRAIEPSRVAAATQSSAPVKSSTDAPRVAPAPAPIVAAIEPARVAAAVQSTAPITPSMEAPRAAAGAASGAVTSVTTSVPSAPRTDTPPAIAPTAAAASTPAMTAPAPAADSAKSPASTPAASVVKPSAPSAPAASAPAPAAARFAVELGPFMTVTEAERVERRLTQAGFPTVRSRQKTGEGLYAVLLDRITGVAEARTVIGTLRKRGFGEGVLIGQDPPVVRVGEPMPLRRAVDLAERLHAAGHAVRVAVQPGEAVAYTIRHGNFPSKPDARARAQELARLGLSPQVVQIR